MISQYRRKGETRACEVEVNIVLYIKRSPSDILTVFFSPGVHYIGNNNIVAILI